MRENMERYSVSFRVQSECAKMRTRITPDTETFYAVPVVSLSIQDNAKLLQQLKSGF